MASRRASGAVTSVGRATLPQTRPERLGHDQCGRNAWAMASAAGTEPRPMSGRARRVCRWHWICPGTVLRHPRSPQQ